MKLFREKESPPSFFLSLFSPSEQIKTSTEHILKKIIKDYFHCKEFELKAKVDSHFPFLQNSFLVLKKPAVIIPYLKWRENIWQLAASRHARQVCHLHWTVL